MSKTTQPIHWDGTARSADAVLRHMPDLTVSTCGGAPGIPVELALQTKRGRILKLAKPGDWIGVDRKGNAVVVKLPKRKRRS